MKGLGGITAPRVFLAFHIAEDDDSDDESDDDELAMKEFED